MRYNAAGRCDHGDAVGHAAGRGFRMFGLRFGLGLGDVLSRVGGRQVGLVFGLASQSDPGQFGTTLIKAADGEQQHRDETGEPRNVPFHAGGEARGLLLFHRRGQDRVAAGNAAAGVQPGRRDTSQWPAGSA